MTDNRPNAAHTCGQPCEVYSRICGYFRPVANWNRGKKEEFRERRPFIVKK
ncbi:MAG: hypothetical protein IJQ39_14190 [Thermoguttaceae bacterium]|nr:hypothetical protein [Thermoguttaceae bacterium]